MSLLTASIPIEDFNPNKDKIALMLKSFTITAKDEGIGKKKRQYSEPYFVGLSLSESGFGAQQINFVTDSYPKTRRGDRREFLGNGMRVYGPENPGGFLVFDILVMESDSDVRAVGDSIRSIMNSKEVKGTILPLLAVNPSMAVAVEVLSATSNLIGKILQNNKDDQLMRVHGTLMRDIMGSNSLPFNVGQIISDKNDFASVEFEVLGIKNNTRFKPKTEQISSAG
jgi:hypothetical protein